MKRIPTVLLFFILAIIFTSCVNEDKEKIYYDDALLIEQGDSYSYVSRSMNKIADKVSLKFSMFYGKETLLSIERKEKSSLKLSIDFSKDSGLLKLCLIYPDNSIEIITEETYSGAKSFNIPEGKTRLIIAGKKAKGSVKVNVVHNI